MSNIECTKLFKLSLSLNQDILCKSENQENENNNNNNSNNDNHETDKNINNNWNPTEDESISIKVVVANIVHLGMITASVIGIIIAYRYHSIKLVILKIIIDPFCLHIYWYNLQPHIYEL